MAAGMKTDRAKNDMLEKTSLYQKAASMHRVLTMLVLMPQAYGQPNLACSCDPVL